MIKKFVSKLVLLAYISGFLFLDASHHSYAFTKKENSTTIIVSDRKRKSSLDKIHTILFNEIGIEHILEEKNFPKNILSFSTHLGLITQHSAVISTQLSGFLIKCSSEMKNEWMISKNNLDVRFDNYKKEVIRAYFDFQFRQKLQRGRSEIKCQPLHIFRQTVNTLNKEGIVLAKQFEGLKNDVQKYTNITGFGLLLFCCFVNGVIIQYVLMSGIKE